MYLCAYVHRTHVYTFHDTVIFANNKGIYAHKVTCEGITDVQIPIYRQEHDCFCRSLKAILFFEKNITSSSHLRCCLPFSRANAWLVSRPTRADHYSPPTKFATRGILNFTLLPHNKDITAPDTPWPSGWLWNGALSRVVQRYCIRPGVTYGYVCTPDVSYSFSRAIWAIHF